ncbi:uncharacterized protein L203_101419 [Cryptococcus depauperatus CBS 7841]|uniref:Chromo domain-containing protein n=1 Tax=Cryptococcus depauperatus CBS 7841 TaxID=1295531 RepID=A0AAJ8JPR7_9TREE
MPTTKDEKEPEADRRPEEESLEEDEYEVEAIIDHRQKGSKLEYRVSWRGYGPEHDTWEPEINVSHAADVVNAYWEKVKAVSKSASKKRARASKETVRSKTASASPSLSTKSANKKQRINGSKIVKKKVESPEPSKDELSDDGDEVDGRDDVVDDIWDEEYRDNLEKYYKQKNWENLVKNIATCETDENDLRVFYVTMQGGEKGAVLSEIAYDRFPKKCCYFFDTHLRWRPSDDTDQKE